MARAWLTDLTVASALVLAVASLVVAEIPTKCPKTDVGNVTVNLAHENDCTKYYGCSGGQKWLKQCPLMDTEGNRLHFNPSLQVCDWPENVDCKLPNGWPVVAIRAAVRAAECPKVDPLNHTVHLAHETDCTKFYKCGNGVKYEMECPTFNDEGDRLYFNATLELCDWPWNVTCEVPKMMNKISKIAMQRNVFEPVAEIPTKCPKHDSPNVVVHLAHETDCTKFYKCDRGVKHEMSCPAFNDEGDKLYFNVSLQVCDWPWNVNCEKPKMMNRIAMQPEVVEPVPEIPTKCPKHDSPNVVVHLAHETDCTKFYKCDRGVKHEMSCPAFNDEGDKLYFNASLQLCDWPWNVDCKQVGALNTISRAVVTVAEVPTQCPKVDQVNQTVHLAHESDCSKFYKCGNGVKHEMECPVFTDEGDRLFFNVTLQACDWPWNVDCKQVGALNTISRAVVPVAEVPTKCPKVDQVNQTVHLAHESDCSKFYKCGNGVKYEMECPTFNDEGDRLFFNVTIQACDWPWNVDCKQVGALNTISRAVVPVAEVPTKCPKVDQVNQTVHLAHESDCSKFYKCGNGVKHEMECPTFNDEGDRLFFNVTIQACDWPWNVNCTQPKTIIRMEVPKSRAAVKLAAEIPKQCPKVDEPGKTINLAHETDCTQYYACSHGKKWLMDCPYMSANEDRLHFNAETQLCDFPENANCNL